MKIHVSWAAALFLAQAAGAAIGADSKAAVSKAGVEIDAGSWAISCPKPMSRAGEVAVRTITRQLRESRAPQRVVARCLYLEQGNYPGDLMMSLRALAAGDGIVSRLPADNAVVVVDAPDRVALIVKAFEALSASDRRRAA
jgi:hypothetical protein